MSIEIIANHPACHTVRISPQLARDWIALIPEKQRSLSERCVDTLVRAMKEGRWIDLLGDPIRFDRKGACVDGQHRLYAVSRSGYTITSFVVVGLGSDAIHQIDQDGKKRSHSDALKIAGILNANAMGAASPTIWRIQNCVMTKSHISGPDTQQSIDLLRKHPEIHNGVQFIKMASPFIPGGAAVGLYYLFVLRDADAAHRFMTALCEGTQISNRDKTSGIWLYRNQLVRIQSRPGLGMTTVHKVALAIKAWNAMRANRVLRSLRWRYAEGFPEIL